MEEVLNNLRTIEEGAPPIDYNYQWLWLILVLVIIALISFVLKRLFPLFVAYRRLTQIKFEEERFLPLVNLWLKETVLIMYPRDVVAPLHSLNWLRFLDKTGGTNFEAFANAWTTVMYDHEKVTVSDDDKKLLVKECKKWLIANIRRRIWAL
jgi:hypothetical protein